MEPVDHIPVWFMRQAGRYQPEYRKIKQQYSLTEIVERPEVCTEVTLLPVRQLNVDAAILFADIMTPIGPMGIPNQILPNKGPHIPNPVRSVKDVESIRIPDFAESLPYVGETIRNLSRALKVPLIGFCGAPFTLASYIIEGGPSKSFHYTKTMMYREPEMWASLMKKLVAGMAAYLTYQVDNGAQALQIFDSWVGHLSRQDYDRYVFPYMSDLFGRLKKTLPVPVIHFGVHTGHLLERMQAAGGDVIGIDWKTSLPEAWKRLQYKVAVQGNLDPTLLFAPEPLLKERIYALLDRIDRPGFIFNLGHGVLPPTEVSTLQRVTEWVHAYRPADVMNG